MLSFRFSCVCLRLIRILLTGTHHPRPSILLYPLSSLRGREIGSPGKTLAEQTWDNPRASYSRICLFRLMQIFCWVGDMVIRIVPPFLTRLGTLWLLKTLWMYNINTYSYVEPYEADATIRRKQHIWLWWRRPVIKNDNVLHNCRWLQCLLWWWQPF